MLSGFVDQYSQRIDTLLFSHGDCAASSQHHRWIRTLNSVNFVSCKRTHCNSESKFIKWPWIGIHDRRNSFQQVGTPTNFKRTDPNNHRKKKVLILCHELEKLP